MTTDEMLLRADVQEMIAVIRVNMAVIDMPLDDKSDAEIIETALAFSKDKHMRSLVAYLDAIQA